MKRNKEIIIRKGVVSIDIDKLIHIFVSFLEFRELRLYHKLMKE